MQPLNQSRNLLITNCSVYATTNTTDYPFGTHLWDFSNDVCSLGGSNATAVVVLNLNACDENEFNCVDGTCIDMEKRWVRDS